MPPRKSRRSSLPQVRQGPSSDDAHAIVYLKRHPDDDPSETSPGREFLRKVCPPGVRAKFNAVLNAVAAAPPKRFAGGGAWEAMHGDMTGWFEVRRDGPGRRHYRLFCLLDYEAEGQDKPLLVVIDGRDKPFRTELSQADYNAVRALGDEYRRRNPRSIS
ncbi:MAG: hypothetical protein ACRDSK_03485 [Actinophytocola sp.]|uniref:hypothetical protein n=1 Tax=Actinophytocola sp. TaxID=1872138 RepID=UPI003D6AB4E8